MVDPANLVQEREPLFTNKTLDRIVSGFEFAGYKRSDNSFLCFNHKGSRMVEDEAMVPIDYVCYVLFRLTKIDLQ